MIVPLECSHVILLQCMVQMSHVEVSKEEKLADTMRGWYANAKARQAEYAQQLARLEASAIAESSIAFNSLTGDEPACGTIGKLMQS